jgi:hypothetical protein
VGDRVLAHSSVAEEDLSLGAKIDSRKWQQLTLRASKSDGSWADIVLIRSQQWVADNNAKVGASVLLSVPECGIDGLAEIFSIDHCPVILPSDDPRMRVVTGTFCHYSTHVVDLFVEGQAHAIGTTPNHRFWSEDRMSFVRVDDLALGEHLRGVKAITRVVQVTPRANSRHSVYNLEVHGIHVYHVSADGILVHNGTAPAPQIFPVQITQGIGNNYSAFFPQRPAANLDFTVSGTTITISSIDNAGWSGQGGNMIASAAKELNIQPSQINISGGIANQTGAAKLGQALQNAANTLNGQGGTLQYTRNQAGQIIRISLPISYPKRCPP